MLSGFGLVNTSGLIFSLYMVAQLPHSLPAGSRTYLRQAGAFGRGLLINKLHQLIYPQTPCLMLSMFC